MLVLGEARVCFPVVQHSLVAVAVDGSGEVGVEDFVGAAFLVRVREVDALAVVEKLPGRAGPEHASRPTVRYHDQPLVRTARSLAEEGRAAILVQDLCVAHIAHRVGREEDEAFGVG